MFDHWTLATCSPTGGPTFDFVLDFFKQKTKAYKRNRKFGNTLKNIYLIKKQKLQNKYEKAKNEN